MSQSPLWSLLLTLVLPLPIGTDRRRARIPWVTYTLLALNIILYFAAGPDASARWGFLPSAPHWLTLLTYMFVHVSIWHLLFNMIFLWLFGPHVEDVFGPVAFLALYLGGGVAAGLLHMAIAWLLASRAVSLSEPLAGASGAISAILAPFAIRFHRAQLRLFWWPGLLFGRGWAHIEVPAIAGLGLWLLETVAGAAKSVIAPTPGGVAYWAHLGGFVFGLVAAELTGLLREGRQDYLWQEARAAARDPQRRDEAATRYRAVVDSLLARNDWPNAVAPVAEALALGLAVLLSPRERLRLAGVAAEQGQTDTAVSLLRALITETPTAPEDEMARLKLGQLLLPTDPVAARAVLSSFLTKYPQSEWTRRAHTLCADAETSLGQSAASE